MKRKVQEYFFYFMLYSMIGWIYEVFLEVVVYRWGFSNRGVLFGPYCVIYGFGALILIFTLGGLQKEDLSGEDSGDAASGICGNCCDYHGGRIDRKLYYGIYFRRLDVGLYPVCL